MYYTYVYYISDCVQWCSCSSDQESLYHFHTRLRGRKRQLPSSSWWLGIGLTRNIHSRIYTRRKILVSGSGIPFCSISILLVFRSGNVGKHLTSYTQIVLPCSVLNPVLNANFLKRYAKMCTFWVCMLIRGLILQYRNTSIKAYIKCTYLNL